MNRIKELREERHMTQTRLAIEIGVSQETISAYETGKHSLSVDALIRLSEFFRVSTDYLLGLNPRHTPAESDRDLTPAEAELLRYFCQMNSEEQSYILTCTKNFSKFQKER